MIRIDVTGFGACGHAWPEHLAELPRAGDWLEALDGTIAPIARVIHVGASAADGPHVRLELNIPLLPSPSQQFVYDWPPPAQFVYDTTQPSSTLTPHTFYVVDGGRSKRNLRQMPVAGSA